MNEFPNRKSIRIADYDYSTPGAYFITVCINDRKPILWNVGAATCRPNLSKIGAVVEMAILQITEHYPAVSVDKYCVITNSYTLQLSSAYVNLGHALLQKYLHHFGGVV